MTKFSNENMKKSCKLGPYEQNTRCPPAARSLADWKVFYVLKAHCVLGKQHGGLEQE